MANVLVYHAALAALCYATRRRDVGGWLLFYLIELLFYTLVRTATAWHGMVADVEGFWPSHWENPGLWVAFLLTTVPLPVATLLTFGVGFPTVAVPRCRQPFALSLLVRLLRVELGAACLLIVVDALIWSDYVLRDLNTLVWPLVWIAYFGRSERVARLFGLDAGPAPRA